MIGCEVWNRDLQNMEFFIVPSLLLLWVNNTTLELQEVCAVGFCNLTCIHNTFQSCSRILYTLKIPNFCSIFSSLRYETAFV